MGHARTKVEDGAYVTGFDDGYAGNSYVPTSDTIPAELADVYKQEYYRGYYDGQLSFRRTTV